MIPLNLSVLEFQDVSFCVFYVAVGKVADLNLRHCTSHLEIRYETDVQILELRLIQCLRISGETSLYLFFV